MWTIVKKKHGLLLAILNELTKPFSSNPSPQRPTAYDQITSTVRHGLHPTPSHEATGYLAPTTHIPDSNIVDHGHYHPSFHQLSGFFPSSTYGTPSTTTTHGYFPPPAYEAPTSIPSPAPVIHHPGLPPVTPRPLPTIVTHDYHPPPIYVAPTYPPPPAPEYLPPYLPPALLPPSRPRTTSPPVMFNDAPKLVYGISFRVRRRYVCGKNGIDCLTLEKQGKVVDCDIPRFRYKAIFHLCSNLVVIMEHHCMINHNILVHAQKNGINAFQKTRHISKKHLSMKIVRFRIPAILLKQSF